MRKISMCLIFGALFAGCAVTVINQSQLALLDKGISADEVVSRLKMPPSATHHATADGRSFDFVQYRMDNGLQSARYLMAFEGGKLVYWGYLDEFRKHPDKSLAAAAGQIAGAVAAVR